MIQDPQIDSTQLPEGFQLVGDQSSLPPGFSLIPDEKSKLLPFDPEGLTPIGEVSGGIAKIDKRTFFKKIFDEAQGYLPPTVFEKINDKAQKYLPLLPADSAVKSKVSRLQGEGTTNIRAGVNKAAEVALSASPLGFAKTMYDQLSGNTDSQELGRSNLADIQNSVAFMDQPRRAKLQQYANALDLSETMRGNIKTILNPAKTPYVEKSKVDDAVKTRNVDETYGEKVEASVSSAIDADPMMKAVVTGFKFMGEGGQTYIKGKDVDNLVNSFYNTYIGDKVPTLDEKDIIRQAAGIEEDFGGKVVGGLAGGAVMLPEILAVGLLTDGAGLAGETAGAMRTFGKARGLLNATAKNVLIKSSKGGIDFLARNAVFAGDTSDKEKRASFTDGFLISLGDNVVTNVYAHTLGTSLMKDFGVRSRIANGAVKVALSGFGGGVGMGASGILHGQETGEALGQGYIMGFVFGLMHLKGGARETFVREQTQKAIDKGLIAARDAPYIIDALMKASDKESVLRVIEETKNKIEKLNNPLDMAAVSLNASDRYPLKAVDEQIIKEKKYGSEALLPEASQGSAQESGKTKGGEDGGKASDEIKVDEELGKDATSELLGGKLKDLSEAKEALGRYENGNDTITDIVDNIESADIPELRDAVSEFRDEQGYDRELGKRGDMDTAEENFMSELNKYIDNGLKLGDEIEKSKAEAEDTSFLGSLNEQIKAGEKLDETQRRELKKRVDDQLVGRVNTRRGYEIGDDIKNSPDAMRVVAELYDEYSRLDRLIDDPFLSNYGQVLREALEFSMGDVTWDDYRKGYEGWLANHSSAVDLVNDHWKGREKAAARDLEQKKSELRKAVDDLKSFSAKHGNRLSGQSLVDQYNQLAMRVQDLKYELRKPLDVSKIGEPRDRKSIIPAEIINTARGDLVADKKVFDEITRAAIGVIHNAETSVDKVMNGENPNVSANELYDAFNKTRQALKDEYGESITLYRAEGGQKNKPTQNWASTKEGAMQYGNNIVKKEIQIDDIIALNTGLSGKYEEFIVGKPPKEKSEKAASALPKGVEDAVDFSRQAHGEQKRKYTGEPYTNHTEDVAREVSKYTDDLDVVRAALLHDVVEDTGVPLSEIRAKFGDRVADIVSDLTDVYTKENYPDLNRKSRKILEHNRLSKASDEAKLIKTADILNNADDISMHDKSFSKTYLVEAKDLLGKIKIKSPLFDRLSTRLDELTVGKNAVGEAGSGGVGGDVKLKIRKQGSGELLLREQGEAGVAGGGRGRVGGGAGWQETAKQITDQGEGQEQTQEQSKPRGLGEKARDVLDSFYGNIKGLFSTEVLPRLTKSGVDTMGGIEHSYSRLYTKYFVKDLQSKVFPDDYHDVPKMEKYFDILNKNNIVGETYRLAKAWKDEKSLPKKTELEGRLKEILANQDIKSMIRELKEAKKDPFMLKSGENWNKFVVPKMDEMYNEMKGVDKNTPREGRGLFPELGDRVNLLAIGHEAEMEGFSDPLKPIPETRYSNYTNPNIKKDKFTRRAMMTGKYSVNPDLVLTNSFGRRINETSKQRFYKTLIDAGVAEMADSNPGKLRGKETVAMPIDVPETDPGTGITRNVHKTMYVQKDLISEVRGVLNTDLRLEQSRLAGITTQVQMLSLGDITTHIKNMVSVLNYSIGRNKTYMDVVTRLPYLSHAVTLKEVYDVVGEIASDTPKIRREFANMSKLGMGREHYPSTGVQAITHAQDLITSVDMAGRLIMNRRFTNLVESGLAKDSPVNRRNFVQQMGEYNRRLMVEWERALKDKGYSPFIVAGKNFNRFGARVVTGHPGFEAASNSAAIKLRAAHLSGLVIASVLPALANLVTTGTIWGRPGTPVGAIDLGPGFDTENEDDKRTMDYTIIDVFQLLGIRRGLKRIGVNALIEGIKNDDTGSEMAGKALRDFTQTNLHPYIGPGAGLGYKTLTGQRLDMRGGDNEFALKKQGLVGIRRNIEWAREGAKETNPLLYSFISAFGKEDVGGGLQGIGGAAFKQPLGAIGLKRMLPLNEMKKLREQNRMERNRIRSR